MNNLEKITCDLEKIAAEMCDKYCKHPVMCNDPEQWELDVVNGECEVCNNCPLNLFVYGGKDD